MTAVRRERLEEREDVRGRACWIDSRGPTIGYTPYSVYTAHTPAVTRNISGQQTDNRPPGGCLESRVSVWSFCLRAPLCRLFRADAPILNAAERGILIIFLFLSEELLIRRWWCMVVTCGGLVFGGLDWKAAFAMEEMVVRFERMVFSLIHCWFIFIKPIGPVACWFSCLAVVSLFSSVCRIINAVIVTLLLSLCNDYISLKSSL